MNQGYHNIAKTYMSIFYIIFVLFFYIYNNNAGGMSVIPGSTKKLDE